MKTVFLATALAVGMVVSAEASVTQIDQNPFSIELSATAALTIR